MELLLPQANGRGYTKYIIILAAELLCISKAITLPREKFIRDLMSKSYQENNSAKLFETLKPQQRLVNILFDEVKLKKAMRFTGGHVVGHAANKPEELATSALVIELISHYGGSRYIIRIIPVACLKFYQLKEMLLEAAYAVRKNGGYIISFICDNCPLNQQTYIQLSGPGRVYLQPDGLQVFLVYDFIHIFKNIRNNWFTEKLIIYSKQQRICCMLE